MGNNNYINIFSVVKGRENPYRAILIEALENRELSYKARGILADCLAKPKDWSFNAQYLINNSKKDGKDSVLSGLKELEEHKYIYRECVRSVKTGRYVGAIWLVFEVPWDTLGYTAEMLHNEALIRNGIDPKSGKPYSIDPIKGPYIVTDKGKEFIDLPVLNAEPGTTSPLSGFPSAENPQQENPQQENPPLLIIHNIPNIQVDNNNGPQGALLESSPKRKKQSRSKPKQPQAKSKVEFDAQEDLALQSRLKEEAIARGKPNGYPRKFKTLAQKTKWRAATSVIIEKRGFQHLEDLIVKATEAGFSNRESVINYIAKCAKNLQQGTSPIPATAKPIRRRSSTKLTADQINQYYQ